jgi:inhibitor of KinA sporulation pathway (predicted exonuclease)
MENVMARHYKWITEMAADAGATIVVCTCGDWDLKKCLRSQCGRRGWERPAIYKHCLNIKTAFQELYGQRKEKGMAGMLEHLKLPLDGRHHSGLDDTRNLAKVFERMVADGFRPAQMKLTECG